MPLKIFLYRDPITGDYGYSAHTEAFNKNNDKIYFIIDL